MCADVTPFSRQCGPPARVPPSSPTRRSSDLAVNQKGPEAALLAALHAIRGAGKKPPVNLVLVAEGEEEIGSPHIGQIVGRPEVKAALSETIGVFMPAAMQGVDGVVTVNLGSKGVVELELVSSGDKWGRGPDKDIHS